MKILFINSSAPNYVADGLFHGLNQIPDVEVVDSPRMNYMYSNATTKDLDKTGTRGNTLYKLLTEKPEISGERTLWNFDIDTYDRIIFTDIFAECDLFNFIYKTLHVSRRDRICIVDGYDVNAIFPYFTNMTNLKVRPWVYFYPIRQVRYFKREFETASSLYGISPERFKGLNTALTSIMKTPPRLLPISMSIPEEHIENIPWSAKNKDFIDYNLDPALGELFQQRPVAELGKWQPAFANQADYFNEIRGSRFGITTKRAGWDCLRHYEYAAKGAILCFKDLEKKNLRCAPHLLTNKNCIPYSDKNDLLKKIAGKSNTEMEELQGQQYEWVRQFSTLKVALRFLEQLLN